MTKTRRSTIEDVAEKAGVSRATVDRVINGRGGVKRATVEKVERVIASLRYSSSSLDEIARPRQRKIEAIVSDGTNPFFTEIRRALELQGLAGGADLVRVQTFDPYTPTSLVACLKTVAPGTDAVIMVGADNPAVASEIARLTNAGTRVITIISDVSISDMNIHIGQDSFVAGKTAARLMLSALGDRTGSIAIMIGHLQFRHLLERRAGFEQSVQLSGRDLQIVQVPPYGADPQGFADVMQRHVLDRDDLAGVYLSGGGQPVVFDALEKLPASIPIIAHEVTERTRAGLASGLIDAVVAHDMSDVARAAVEVAIADTPVQPGRCRIHIHVAENLPERR